MREAIARLITEGLATRAGGVPTVNAISVGEIMEILHVRRLLECDAARQAASSHADPEPLIALRMEVEAMLDGPPPEPARHAELDEALHLAVAEAAGSALLREMIAGLKRKTRIFGQSSIPGRLLPGAREHLEIMDAVLARKPSRAERAMRAHIEATRDAILAHVRRLF